MYLKNGKKTQDKATVEDTVGKVVTAIITSLRNVKLNSFEELCKAIKERLEVFNPTPCHFSQQSKQTEYTGKYEKGIIGVIDALNTLESNTTYITSTFSEKIKMIIDIMKQSKN